MRNLLRVAGIFFAAELCAAALPPATPITTAAELRAAASEVSVAKIDFTVPETESAAEEALAERFFNLPEEHRYSGMSTADWSAKWQLFSDSLVAKAKTLGLDSRSLGLCLRALNRGRNRQTMRWPAQDPPLPPDTPDEKREAYQKKAEDKYQLALKERDKHPEQWYDDSTAIVPVAAYLARHARGDCWIVVCKWEMVSKDEASQLGHIMIWALDRQSATVVGYVTCD